MDRAHVLATNDNLLIIADVLVVNRGFADKHPDMVAGLVEGLVWGNHEVRTNPAAPSDTPRGHGWRALVYQYLGVLGRCRRGRMKRSSTRWRRRSGPAGCQLSGLGC